MELKEQQQQQQADTDGEERCDRTTQHHSHLCTCQYTLQLKEAIQNGTFRDAVRQGKGEEARGRKAGAVRVFVFGQLAGSIFYCHLVSYTHPRCLPIIVVTFLAFPVHLPHDR
jgi:hypothetical protein